MKSTALRVGVVGCGGMGSVHLKAWSTVSNAKVSAVCDVDASVLVGAIAPTTAARYGAVDAMLSGGDLDIVDVCTPPKYHSGAVLAALAAGADVVCEKPLARTAVEASEIVEAADRSGRRLMVAFCHRFHPPIVFARELIASGDLGRVVMFRNRFCGLFAGVQQRWFSDPDVAGGGALLDTAIHSIDLFRFLVGEIESAHGLTAAYLSGIRVEDSTVFTLQSVDGAIGVIEASWATPMGRNVVEVYGSAGMCIVDYDSGELKVATKSMVDAGQWPETRSVGAGDRFQAELQHFANVVGSGDALLVSGHDGLRAVEVAEMVYRSAGRV